MPPRKSSKKASSTSSTGKKETPAALARRAKQEAEAAATAAWIDEHDPLVDRCTAPGQQPITIDYLFQTKLAHKTFNPRNGAQTATSQPFDWSNFRQVLEGRNAMSPRWFVQLREEDLLLGPDGLDGVTVDCFVVAESSVPTLAPAEYVVKEHWPYSDVEDNAPERILPLEGQQMCWRRVVKNDGSDINVFLLQRRSDPTTAAAAAAASAASAASFGFGSTPKAASGNASSSGETKGPSSSATSSTAPSGFGFSFGSNPAPTAPATTTAATAAPSGFGFGFGTTSTPAPAAPAPTAPPAGFGFGFGAASTPAPAAPATFSFGASPPAAASAATAPATGSAAAVAPPADGAQDDPAVRVKPLKTTEVLFCLWAKSRLTEMAKEVKSGSRIVRAGFELRDPATGAVDTKIKLVMDNDLHDKVDETAETLLLNRLFAKSDSEVKEMDEWIEQCPVYDEHLTSALQDFRHRYLNELAGESEAFAEMKKKYFDAVKRELERIVVIRKASAQIELDRIAEIQSLIKDKKLAEKSSFRLLKYYAKNDVLPFRPFGKVSGISESGESVDVCEPPAHVNINPFTGKPM